MPHLSMPTGKVENKKMMDKVVGFNGRMLDDGTFILRIENTDYEKSKEYSFKTFGELMESLHKDFGKKGQMYLSSQK